MTRQERQLLWYSNIQQVRRDYPHKGKIKFLGWYKVVNGSALRDGT